MAQAVLYNKYECFFFHISGASHIHSSYELVFQNSNYSKWIYAHLWLEERNKVEENPS